MSIQPIDTQLCRLIFNIPDLEDSTIIMNGAGIDYEPIDKYVYSIADGLLIVNSNEYEFELSIN